MDKSYKTLTSSNRVVVYEKLSESDSYDESASDLYACSRNSDKRTLLIPADGRTYGSDTSFRVLTAGSTILVTESDYSCYADDGCDIPNSRLNIFDLRRPKRHVVIHNDHNPQSVDNIVLATSGSAAWAVNDGRKNVKSRVWVLTFLQKKPRTIFTADAADRIEKLRLKNQRLSWNVIENGKSSYGGNSTQRNGILH